MAYEATTETFPILSRDAASGRIVVEVGKKISAMDAHEGSLGTWAQARGRRVLRGAYEVRDVASLRRQGAADAVVR